VLTPVFLAGLLPTWRSRGNRVALLALGLLSTTFFFETWVQPQYFAVGAGAIYVILINGARWSLAQRRSRRRTRLAAAIAPATSWGVIAAVAARVILVPVIGWPPAWNTRSFELLTFERLDKFAASLPGKQLVIVRYNAAHRWQDSWINNGSDFKQQKVLWARSTDPAGDSKLACDFADRRPWVVEEPVPADHVDVDRTDPGRLPDVSGLLQPFSAIPGACR
jgi:hypothetical protein